MSTVENQPEWWNWELEISAHMEKRMRDRGFTEIDLRIMLQDAKGYRADEERGRWVMETQFRASPWEVIVEPDYKQRVLVAVTAYPVK